MEKSETKNIRFIIFVRYLFAFCLTFSVIIHVGAYASYYIATHTEQKESPMILSDQLKEIDVSIEEIPPELLSNKVKSNPAPVEKEEWVEGKKKEGKDPDKSDIDLNALSGDGTDKDGYLYSFNGDKVPTPIVDFDLKQFFPDAAKRANITDKTVVVLVQISETGKLMGARVVSGKAGYGFDEAALKIVKLARFTPGYVKGKPVKMAHRLPITFTLDE